MGYIYMIHMYIRVKVALVQNFLVASRRGIIKSGDIQELSLRIIFLMGIRPYPKRQVGKSE